MKMHEVPHAHDDMINSIAYVDRKGGQVISFLSYFFSGD